jgi:hypothetical protein
MFTDVNEEPKNISSTSGCRQILGGTQKLSVSTSSFIPGDVLDGRDIWLSGLYSSKEFIGGFLFTSV